MNANERRRTGPAVLNRVLGYMLHYYKYLFILVIGCILVSAVCTVVGATFPQTLIDEYIEPMLSTGSRDFTGLAQDIKQLVCIMGAGVIASFGYNRIMVNVSQGTLRHLRDDLFHKMESLPIKYFDTHAHGDIMSVYTNDVDTLRQLLSQSIPQLINSSFTMVATLITMIIMSPALTVVSVLAAIAMFTVTKNFSRLSGKYFVKQQRALGEVDGFIEEMLDGQKVVKVFCHEEAAKADFHKVNEALRQSANLANRYSNLLMPINMNIGWLSYALVAIVGAVLAINGMAGVTLGTVVTFVGLHKSFTNPIAQVSMQINFVVTAAAGAQRVFDLMDQTPEKDEGYVELVNAREDAEGRLYESAERTNVWAWKHPHRAEGTVTYTRLEGSVVFEDVDFGYDENKLVLHDISLWAKPGQKIAAGPEDRLRGRHRRGQDHHHQPDQPLLRHRRRQDPLRRHQHQQDQEERPAPQSGHRPPGHPPVHRHGDGEHPLRQSGRHRRGVHGRRQAGQRRRLHPPAARRVQHHAHR